MLRIGIVGRRGLDHLSGFRSHYGAEVVGFADPDPGAQDRARDLGIPQIFHHFASLVDAVDAVFVATPMHLHTSQTLAAFEAGRHVMCEVTACDTREEAAALRAAMPKNRVATLAENYLFFRENVLVSELVRKGFFGEPTYAEGAYLHDVKNYHHRPDGSLTWRAQSQVGKRGNTYITHSLGPCLEWFRLGGVSDRVERVVCLGTGPRTDPEHPHDDRTETLCNTEDGRLVRVGLDMMSNRPHNANWYALQGTHGVYETGRIWLGENPPPGYHSGVHREWTTLERYAEHLPGWYRDLEGGSFGHGGADHTLGRLWVEACLGERENPVPFDRGLHWTEVGLASQESIVRGGEPVGVGR